MKTEPRLAKIAIMATAGLGSICMIGQVRVWAQTSPAFEVASVKQSPAGGSVLSWSWGNTTGKVRLTRIPLTNVLMQAYKVDAYQISGPPWLTTEYYDIVANAPEGAPKEQIPQMLQALLADRFKMTLHRESQSLPVYALPVGRTGPKLKEADPSGPKGLSYRISSVEIRIKGQIPTAMLATGLSSRLDRPVLDLTGLKGIYDIDLAWAPEVAGSKTAMGTAAGAVPDASQPGPAPDASMPGPSIFSAIQETLGLRLEARKAPIEMLVIDHVEKVPTEN